MFQCCACSFSSIPSHNATPGNPGTRGESMSPTIHATGSAGWQTTTPAVANGAGPDGIASSTAVGRSARVLYDYDAADIKELSLIADEVIFLR